MSLETGLQELPNESEWMNIYHDGKKMGYAVYTIENLEGQGYNLKSSTHINLVFGGLESEVDIESSAAIDTLFRLKTFSFWMHSDQYSTHIIGNKNGTQMSLYFIQGEDTTETQMSVPENLYTYTAIQPMVASKGIVQGQTMRVPAYDPMSNEMADVIISHEGKEVQSIQGNSMLLNKLRIEFQGIPSIMWLDDNGITYKEQTVMGMTMVRTTPGLALEKPPAPEVDLISGFSVTPDLPIRRTRDLDELILEIEGLDPASLKLLQSERQIMVKEAPLTLKISRKATPVQPEETSRSLQATEMIQSDHPKIRNKVNSLLAEKQSPTEASKQLTSWVYNYLEKRPVASISGAVDVLETGIGDCTEHSTLYAALSRAYGIPTRIHIGLVYLQGRFLFHAWPVVAVNGEWVDVDPSLDQYPADATHIALLEGDFENFSSLIPALGNIRIKVLEQSY